MTVDDKAWLIEAVRGMKVEDAVQLLYPRIVAVSQLEVNLMYQDRTLYF